MRGHEHGLRCSGYHERAEFSVSCDMKLHTVLLGWRRLLTKPCVSPQVAARQVIHRLLRRRESLLMEVEVSVQADANSMSAAKAEKPAPNARSIPFWPGCGRPLSRISRKTNRTEGDDMLP